METLKTIASRKSTKAFKPEQISEKELETVLLAGSNAAVGRGAYDSLHMTIIQSPDALKKVITAAQKAFGDPSRDPTYAAPTLIVVSAVKNQKVPNIEFANAASVIVNMHLAATDIGLGSCYIWGFLAGFAAEPDLAKELGIPDGFTPASGILLGYPVEPLDERELQQKINTNKV